MSIKIAGFSTLFSKQRRDGAGRVAAQIAQNYSAVEVTPFFDFSIFNVLGLPLRLRCSPAVDCGQSGHSLVDVSVKERWIGARKCILPLDGHHFLCGC
jgi:hypothetical protein